MDSSEFELLMRMQNPDAGYRFDDLIDFSPRTLLLGTTKAGHIFHVYLKDGRIHRLIYRADSSKVLDYHASDFWNVWSLAPDDGVHPEQSDFQFMTALVQKRVDFTFHPFSGPARSKLRNHAFYALTKEDF